VRGDRLLDRAKTGPRWLDDPRTAACVLDTIRRGVHQLNQFQLHAYVIMPNHVHLLIVPRVPVTKIMRGIKGVSAHDANRILGQSGGAFWQDESFDRWVRNEQEFGRILYYIECNPVRAGLVKRPNEWRWSSAWLRAQRLAETGETQEHSQE
jgi:REP element-mobilizing transposase RayT